MIDWVKAQERLGVKADGIAGPVTYGALLSKVANHTVSVGASFAKNIPDYQVDGTPERLSAFIGQCCHESQGFRFTREIWGPTAYQAKYDTRADLGNYKAGDGFKYRGAGWIEVTGRFWFDKIGHMLGMDLINHPELANDPNISTLNSLAWWKLNSMNAIADQGDDLAVTRKVNPGLLGLADRVAFTDIARGL